MSEKDCESNKKISVVFGKRVLVKKHQVDLGVFKATPGMEEDGQKNRGIIVKVGQVGLLNKLKGLKEGKTIIFKRHFVANHDQQDPLVFVDVENIMGIE